MTGSQEYGIMNAHIEGRERKNNEKNNRKNQCMNGGVGGELITYNY